MRVERILSRYPLAAVKQSQQITSGILEAVILIKGDIPRNRNHYRHSRTCEVELNSKYSVVLIYYPSGFNKNRPTYIALQLAIESGEHATNYTKIETAAIAIDETRWFEYSTEKFYPLPLGAIWTVSHLGQIDTILGCNDFFTPGQEDKLVFELKISIDTRWKADPFLKISPATESYKWIKERIRDPSFGDTAFLAGGVAIYAHMDILIRNSTAFKLTFASKKKNGIFYELPDTYPQIFEKMVIGCYVDDNSFCEKCLGIHKTNQVDEILER